MQIAVQINSKLKCRISVPADADENAVKALALENATVIENLAGATVKKAIYIKGRLLNLIV